MNKTYSLKKWLTIVGTVLCAVVSLSIGYTKWVSATDRVTAVSDLIIESITFNPTIPQPNEPFSIVVDVKVEGDEDSAIGNIYLFINPGIEPTAAMTPTYDTGSYNLPWPSDEVFIRSIPVSSLGEGVYEVYAIVDAENEVAESNEENNLFKVILSVGSDVDGDGLPDRIELEGLDLDQDGVIDVDLPAMGADPFHKDVFVEIDYLVGIYNTYAPDSNSIAKIVEAFDRAPVDNPDGETGIHLHVDYGSDAPLTWGTAATWGDLSQSSELPYSEYLSSCAEITSMNWDQFDALKRNHFDSYRAPIFRYNMWGDLLCPERPGTIVASRNDTDSLSAFQRGSSDFIVTVGPWLDDIYTSTPTADQLAGAFMHGLGLTLGLTRGSGDYESYKPNHFSVMNPLFATNGIRQDGEWYHFDYSRSADLVVDENSLNEAAGLGTSPDADGTIIICDDGTTIVQPLDQIDWNCDGDINDGTLAKDINLSGGLGLLNTVNEWELLVYAGGDVGQFDITGSYNGNPFASPAFNLPTMLDVAIVDNVPAFYEETRFGNAAFTGGARPSTTTTFLPYMVGSGMRVYKPGFSVGGAVGTFGSTREYPQLSHILPAEIAEEGYVWNTHNVNSRIKVMRSCLAYRERPTGAEVTEHYNRDWKHHICWDHESGRLVQLKGGHECVTGKPCIDDDHNAAEERFRSMISEHPDDIWLIGNEPDFKWQDALVNELKLHKDDGTTEMMQIGGAETYAQFYAYVYKLGQDALEKLNRVPQLGFCQSAIAGIWDEHPDSGLPYCQEAYGWLDDKLRENGIATPKEDTIYVIATHNYLFHDKDYSHWLDEDQLESRFNSQWRRQMWEFECWAGSGDSCEQIGLPRTHGESELANKPLWLTEYGALRAWCHEVQGSTQMVDGGQRCEEVGRGNVYLGRNPNEGLWGLWTKQIDYMYNQSRRWDGAWLFVSHSGEVVEDSTQCTATGSVWVFQYQDDRNSRRCSDRDLWQDFNNWVPKLSRSGAIYEYIVKCAVYSWCDRDAIELSMAFQQELSFEALSRLYPVQTEPYEPYCKVTPYNDCD